MSYSTRYFETSMGTFESGSQAIAVPSPAGTRLLTDTLAPESWRPIKSEDYLLAVATIGGVLIERANQAERPLLVGVNGLDASGKTEFTRTMSDYLTELAVANVVVHADDFMNNKAGRHAGTNDTDNYLNHAIDFAAIASGLLTPVRHGETPHATFRHYHPASDEAQIVHSYQVPEAPSIVLTEGIFIFRGEMQQLFDYRIFIHATLDKILDRVRVRDADWGGGEDEVVERYRRKYLPAQAKYLGDVSPQAVSHAIVENSNVLKPAVTFTGREE